MLKSISRIVSAALFAGAVWAVPSMAADLKEKIVDGDYSMRRTYSVTAHCGVCLDHSGCGLKADPASKAVRLLDDFRGALADHDARRHRVSAGRVGKLTFTIRR